MNARCTGPVTLSSPLTTQASFVGELSNPGHSVVGHELTPHPTKMRIVAHRPSAGRALACVAGICLVAAAVGDLHEVQACVDAADGGWPRTCRLPRGRLTGTLRVRDARGPLLLVGGAETVMDGTEAVTTPWTQYQVGNVDRWRGMECSGAWHCVLRGSRALVMMILTCGASPCPDRLLSRTGTRLLHRSPAFAKDSQHHSYVVLPSSVGMSRLKCSFPRAP